MVTRYIVYLISAGTTVKCHEFRFLYQNRKRARELLIEKLDALYNGENSIQNQKLNIQKIKSLKKEQKRKKREKMKLQFKEEFEDIT